MRISTRIGNPETYPPSRFGVSFGPFQAGDITSGEKIKVFRPMDTNRDLIIERVFVRVDTVASTATTLTLETVDADGNAGDTGLSQDLTAAATTSGVELTLTNEFETPVIEGDEWLALTFDSAATALANLVVVVYFRDYDYS